MEELPRKDISQVFEEGTPIDNALREAVRDAVLRHKHSGNPIADWQDGKVVWIPADQIQVDMDTGQEANG